MLWAAKRACAERVVVVDACRALFMCREQGRRRDETGTFIHHRTNDQRRSVPLSVTLCAACY